MKFINLCPLCKHHGKFWTAKVCIRKRFCNSCLNKYQNSLQWHLMRIPRYVRRVFGSNNVVKTEKALQRAISDGYTYDDISLAYQAHRIANPGRP